MDIFVGYAIVQEERQLATRTNLADKFLCVRQKKTTLLGSDQTVRGQFFLSSPTRSKKLPQTVRGTVWSDSVYEPLRTRQQQQPHVLNAQRYHVLRARLLLLPPGTRTAMNISRFPDGQADGKKNRGQAEGKFEGFSAFRIVKIDIKGRADGNIKLGNTTSGFSGKKAVEFLKLLFMRTYSVCFWL
ncbi:hypothetical protein ACFE04_025402 [Oxalis oulophora]